MGRAGSRLRGKAGTGPDTPLLGKYMLHTSTVEGMKVHGGGSRGGGRVS